MAQATPAINRQTPQAKRSGIGIELVRSLAAEGQRVFSLVEARKAAVRVGMRQSYLTEALHHLERTGWIVRIKRGLYAVSSSIPGVSPVHEFEIAMAMAKPAAISHWSALHHHGLTEQAPRTVFVLTPGVRNVSHLNRSQDRRRHAGQNAPLRPFHFVSIQRKWFFGVENVWVGEARITMTDPERTLLDGLSNPKLCGDFAEVLHAFERRGHELDVKRIIRYALKLDAAMAKRLGWVLEHHGVPAEKLRPLLEAPIRGWRKLDASSSSHGSYIRRWMIQENLPGSFR